MTAVAHHLRRSLKLSLAQQLLLLALLPAAIATLGVMGVLTRQHLASVTELMRANAQTVALQVAAQARAPMADLDRRALARVASAGSYQPQVQDVQIWTEDGEIVADARAPDALHDEGLRSVAPIVAQDGTPMGKVMVQISLANVRALRRSIWLNVLLVLVATLAGVSLAAWWAARRISAPIRALGAAVDRLGAGEEANVNVQGTQEVQRLQHGFNQAATALLQSQRLLQTRIDEATAELARKNQQLELASQAKTRLLAAASHDLRQPLHALTLFSDALAKGETDPLRLQRIGHMRECVDSLDRLFTELLNLSQLDAGVLQPHWSDFALDRVFGELSRNFRALAEQHDLRLVLRKTDAWVRCDYVMLARILNNLVSNALRHTKTGGVLVGARRRGQALSIEVWDTGIGVAPEFQQRVFEEFFQIDHGGAGGDRNAHGMGLGLATVQRLAQLLNTRVELVSRVGRGTCVRLAVRAASAPAAATPVAPGAGVAAALPANVEGVRVLVIDDEHSILEGLQAVLSSWGAHVMTADSRAQALALADQWPEPPDVVVSDLLLKGGDNGLQVIEALERHPRGIGAATARLLVTGETKPERLREVAASGIAVLYKPVAPQALRRAIAAQLTLARVG